jgi:hypothetical protein
MDVYMSFMP